jgi:hypothetical protein
MPFQPKVLNPTPDPWFVRELRLIDPELRVRWGMERYLKNSWVVERRLSPEEYYTKYRSVTEEDRPRFTEQPIFDVDQAVTDPQTGEFVSYKQVGVRDYDLAPEWDSLGFYDTLDARAVLEIKKAYAYNRNQPYSRERFEQAQREEEEARDAAVKAKRLDAGYDKLDEVFLNTRVKVQFGAGEKRNERCPDCGSSTHNSCI